MIRAQDFERTTSTFVGYASLRFFEIRTVAYGTARGLCH